MSNRETFQLARPILSRSNLGVLSLKMGIKKREKAAKQMRLFLLSYRDQAVVRDDIRINIQRMQGLWCCKFSLKDLIAPV